MKRSHGHLFVLTGGPGSGKTTLVEALRTSGIATSPETGREIIREQRAIGGRALPWGDRALYAELMLSREMRNHAGALARREVTVFDRGVPDVLGYLRLCGIDPPDHVRRAAELFRYNGQVFVLPPWPEIYGADEERRQDFAEAVRTFEVMAETYGGCGYELTVVPKADVAARADFVRRAMDACRQD